MESPFTHLLELLAEIEDPRRAEGKLYKLPHVLLFSILAMMAGANSYRGIHSFVEVHLARLKETFGLAWRRAPAYTTIRNVLQGLEGSQVERVFRLHGEILRESARFEGLRVVAFDGKTLRGSNDHFTDKKATHLVSAFDIENALVLGHIEVDDKSNEIPAVERLIGELGLAGCVVIVDAMHCQKNLASANSCMNGGRTRMSQAIQRATCVRSRLHLAWTAGFVTSDRQTTMGMTLELIWINEPGCSWPQFRARRISVNRGMSVRWIPVRGGTGACYRIALDANW